MPEKDGDKAHAGDGCNQGKAADGRAPQTGPLAPGLHPSPQLIRVSAHAGSSPCLTLPP